MSNSHNITTSHTRCPILRQSLWLNPAGLRPVIARLVNRRPLRPEPFPRHPAHDARGDLVPRATPRRLQIETDYRLFV